MVAFGLVFLVLGLLAWASFYYKSAVFGRMIWQVKTKKKAVALTFDDGPNQPFTLQIADIIESHGGKATFFVVGKNCERFPGVVTELQRRGHLIGAHSYRHAFHRYIIDPFYSQEIRRSKEVLDKQGVKTDWFRFPWLFRTPWLLAAVRKAGYNTPISGQFSHPFEPFQVNAQKIVGSTLKKIKPGAIIIFHDGYNATTAPRFQTAEAVRQITAELAGQGYKFVTVAELLALED